MRYIQDRSFIATLTSVTPDYPGHLDSVEGTPRERRNAWLTVTSPGAIETQQRFWFGYFEGRDAGYQVRTLESAPGGSHYAIWDLDFQNYIGYYPSSKSPTLWRVRVDGTKLKQPEQRLYQGVTLAAPALAMLSVANRPAWDDHYVGVNKPNPLIFKMDVLQVNVAVFDHPAKFRQR
ncbi:hypothetical protein JYG34_04855 [Pseudomonas entomophila]|uniref:hypothetical protein n=1 Tax=Pseudomonas entomophila TaxID=312306 RepID=UPI001BCC3E7B|nr:hypothetical protein [Pseudomonas entomophila]QVM92361.1 hypothetical protein JYG34_04855 [Pseudomonas entomophila]